MMQRINLKPGDPVMWKKPGLKHPWLAELVPAQFLYQTPARVAIKFQTKTGAFKKFVLPQEISIENSPDRT